MDFLTLVTKYLGVEGEIYPECVYESSPRFDNATYNNGFMCKTMEQTEELSELLIKTARQFQGFDEEEQENE